jgi:hypothetical protein
MSNPKFDEYKEQYSKFVGIVVEYHNRHQDFVKNKSEISAQDLKRMLRQLRLLEKEMIANIWDAYIINKKGMKELLKMKQNRKEINKRNPPPIQTPRKEKKHDSPNN